MKKAPKRLTSMSAAAEKSQRSRFIDKAREIACDESGHTFEKAFSKIVPPAKAPEKKR